MGEFCLSKEKRGCVGGGVGQAIPVEGAYGMEQLLNFPGAGRQLVRARFSHLSLSSAIGNQGFKKKKKKRNQNKSQNFRVSGLKNTEPWLPSWWRWAQRHRHSCARSPAGRNGHGAIGVNRRRPIVAGEDLALNLKR